MDLTDLAVFAAVARTGGITRAARTLNTVQSNVTARVRHLEHELGVELFERHSRGVTPTTAGRRLLDYADRIAHLVEDARRATTDGLAAGTTLDIGALETNAAVRLPPVLAAFTRANPGVDVTLSTGTTRQLIERVLARDIEGALVAGPVRHAGLDEIAVFEEELVLVTPAGIGKSDVLGAAADRQPKVVVFRAGCSYRRLLEELLARHGASSPRLLEFGTLDGIIGCVAAGLGVTLLPRAAVVAARRGANVTIHALPAAQSRVATVFISRSDAYKSQALQSFIDCACEHARRDRARRRLAA